MDKNVLSIKDDKVLKITAIIMKLDEIEVHGRKNITALLACANALEELKSEIHNESQEECVAEE